MSDGIHHAQEGQVAELRAKAAEEIKKLQDRKTLEKEVQSLYFEGLEKLADSDDFWSDQMYGTRLYFGEGIGDYLHRDVLKAAVIALKEKT